MFFVLVINLIRSPDGFLPQFGAVNGNVGTKTLKVLKILKMDLTNNTMAPHLNLCCHQIKAVHGCYYSKNTYNRLENQ